MIMLTAALLLACLASYLAGTGAVDRFNTIPIRAAGTGLFGVTAGLTILSAAIDFVLF